MPGDFKNTFNISVIIVTWNSEDDIADCIESVWMQNLNVEIICVDNNSFDNTKEIIRRLKEKYENISLIENKENFGYTFASNQGINLSKGKYIFFLNPDTTLTDGAMSVLYGTFDKNEKASVPMILNEDGSLQLSVRNLPTYTDVFFEIFLLSKIFPKSRYFARWKNKYFNYNISQYAEQPMAAAFLIERNTLNELKNFDDRYYMFFNDVDLCKKLHDKNYKIKYLPEAKIKHKKGASIYKKRKKMIEVWNEDCLKYFEKYYGKNLKWYILFILLKITGFIRMLFVENKLLSKIL